MRTKRRGFTLIELLVVIAIIAILAAILFPVFARARAKAQQNNCLSNVKQLMLGVLMYLSDNDHKYWAYNWAQSSVAGQSWCSVIYPYVKNSQIYLCPSSQCAGVTLAVCPPTGGNSQYVTNGGTPPLTYSVEALMYPAELWVIADKAANCENQGPMGYGANCGANTRVGSPHNEGANVGLLDGHAKWMGKNDPLWGNCAFPAATDPMYTKLRHFYYGID